MLSLTATARSLTERECASVGATSSTTCTPPWNEKGCRAIDNKYHVLAWRRVSPPKNTTSRYKGITVYQGGRWWVALAAAITATRKSGQVKIEWRR